MTGDPPTDAPPTEGASAGQSGAVDNSAQEAQPVDTGDIVITATRRNQALSDVPLAVSAADGTFEFAAHEAGLVVQVDSEGRTEVQPAVVQRFVEAESQLRSVTKEQPALAGPWLSLGALQLELRQPRDAEASLQRFLQLLDDPAGPRPAAPADDDEDEEDDDVEEVPDEDGDRGAGEDAPDGAPAPLVARLPRAYLHARQGEGRPWSQRSSRRA